MKEIKKEGNIVFPYKGLNYNICELIQTSDGESFSYLFIPNYEIIDIIPKEAGFEGIQGLDLSIKKEQYFREGIPTFISERVEPQNREYLDELLKSLDLKYYDPLEILLKSKKVYSGDTLFVTPKIEEKEINIEYKKITNNYLTIKTILDNIVTNNKVTINNQSTDAKTIFELLYPIYENLYDKKIKEQIKATNNRKTYKGRPRSVINKEEFRQIYNLYLNKEIKLNDALKILNISRSTFIRTAKLCQK